MSIVRETSDASTFELSSRGEPLVYRAGQFLSFGVTVDGEKLWRAYSMSSSPSSGKLAVTIKRIPQGRVSTYFQEQVKVGDVLEVRGPDGRFTLPTPASSRQLVLIGGGSGITPLMSHLRQALAVEPSTHVTLIYGNRSDAEVIFASELARLREQHPGRLRVRHVLEEPTGALEAGQGRLEQDVVSRELDALGVEDGPQHRYLVCGPEPMMDAAFAVLARRGVPEERMRREHFVAPGEGAPAGALDDDGVYEVTVLAHRRSEVFTARGSDTLLDAAQHAGVFLNYSCRIGECGACIVKLKEGKVYMPEPNCLSDHEKEEGQILACQARPRSAVVLKSY